MANKEEPMQEKQDTEKSHESSEVIEVDETAEQQSVQSEDQAPVDLEALQNELAEAKDQSLRIQAEMQNLRKRTERDLENAHKYALDKFVGELLPVVDNLERAIAAIPIDNDDNQAIIEGVELTLKSFTGVLEKFEVHAIDPKGETFNPDLHQAMTMVPSSEHNPNTIMDVFQKGYTLNGRLVRPAMVVVAKAE